MLRIALFSATALALLGCVNAVGPYNVFTKQAANGVWEVVVLGTSGWGCKGVIKGKASDLYDLPAQTVPLACHGGIDGGSIKLTPNRETRQIPAELTFSNGLVQNLTLQ